MFSMLKNPQNTTKKTNCCHHAKDYYMHDLLVGTNWFPQNSWTGILITTHCIMGKTIQRTFKSVQDLVGVGGWVDAVGARK